MSCSNLLDELGVLRSVDVLCKRDGLDGHPQRDLSAVQALNLLESGLVRDELRRHRDRSVITVNSSQGKKSERHTLAMDPLVE